MSGPTLVAEDCPTQVDCAGTVSRVSSTHSTQGTVSEAVAVAVRWDHLPLIPLSKVMGYMPIEDRQACRFACRSFFAAEEASWDAIKVLAPRYWLPGFLNVAPNTFYTLSDIKDEMERISPVLVDSVRTLDLSAPLDFPPPRILTTTAYAVQRLADTFATPLANVRVLKIFDVLVGHEELAAFGKALPKVQSLGLTPRLYNPASSPILNDEAAQTEEKRCELLRPLRLLPEEIRVLDPLDVMMFHSVLTCFPNLGDLNLYDAPYYD